MDYFYSTYLATLLHMSVLDVCSSNFISDGSCRAGLTQINYTRRVCFGVNDSQVQDIQFLDCSILHTKMGLKLSITLSQWES